MNLYLIKQDHNCGYDTYDSAVVIASSAEEAKTIHPSGYRWENGEWVTDWWGANAEWTAPENVAVKLIGQASSGKDGDVVCASFNAG